MICGSLAGVSISCLGVAALVLLGEQVRPWPLSLYGWWSGWSDGLWPLRFAAGAGVLVLAATPVAMLMVFGAKAVRERRWRTVVAALGITGVLTAGLLLALSGGV